MMTECTPRVVIIPANPELTKEKAVKRQLKVAAYCRVSTDEEEQLSSYEAQQTYYTDKIMNNPEWTMAGLFADQGKTGTCARKRPEFLRMIRPCRKKKIDIVLTKSISRFARNTVDCLHYIRALRELGIAVIFEKEGINTLESDSEMLITILGAFAQTESESISGNIVWGIRQAMREGRVSYQYSRVSLSDIQRQIGELEGRFNLLLEQAAEQLGDQSYVEQFQAITNEIAALKMQRGQMEEQRKSNALAVYRLDTAASLLEKASPELIEWDEAVIRQLVDTVKVLSEDTITVYLRGGIEITQSIVR